MKIWNLLLFGTFGANSAFISSCASSTNHWNSRSIRVDLIPVDATNRNTSEFDQYYRIRFSDSDLIYEVASVLGRLETIESFSRTSQSFGGSSVHFSSSGQTVVIDDDSPGAASSDGHKLIIGTRNNGPLVATLKGPERPGTLIEEWPRVTLVTDNEVTFQYDDDRSHFTISVETLLKTARNVKQVGGGNPFSRVPHL